METTKRAREWHDIKIEGRWKLVFEPTGPLGTQGFGGTHIAAYPSPFDGKKTLLRNIDDAAVNGFIMDSIEVDLRPDTNTEDKYKISWLIAHPGIKLEGIKDVPAKILGKKRGSKITLISIDTKEFTEMDADDFIDRLAGKISMDNGKNALGIDKLRVILAALNMRHRDPRFKGDKERKVLRTKLKKYVKQSLNNAKHVQKIIDNLDLNGDVYSFKEMQNQGIITFDNNIYKYGDVILGRNQDQVIAFLNTNIDIKTEAIAIMKEFLK